MNVYLFTAGMTESFISPPSRGIRRPADRVQIVSTCRSMVVCGENLDEAQQRCETALLCPPEGSTRVQTEIGKIIVTPMVEQLFTESGFEPIDWSEISERIVEEAFAI